MGSAQPTYAAKTTFTVFNCDTISWAALPQENKMRRHRVYPDIGVHSMLLTQKKLFANHSSIAA